MFGGLKPRHEQQKESDYLKNKPLLKVPIISGMHVKNCLKKPLNIQSSRPEMFL